MRIDYEKFENNYEKYDNCLKINQLQFSENIVKLIF